MLIAGALFPKPRSGLFNTEIYNLVHLGMASLLGFGYFALGHLLDGMVPFWMYSRKILIFQSIFNALIHSTSFAVLIVKLPWRTKVVIFGLYMRVVWYEFRFKSTLFILLFLLILDLLRQFSQFFIFQSDELFVSLMDRKVNLRTWLIFLWIFFFVDFQTRLRHYVQGFLILFIAC